RDERGGNATAKTIRAANATISARVETNRALDRDKTSAAHAVNGTTVTRMTNTGAMLRPAATRAAVPTTVTARSARCRVTACIRASIRKRRRGVRPLFGVGRYPGQS